MKKLSSNNNWLPNIFDSNSKIIETLEEQSYSVLQQVKKENSSQNKDLYWEKRPTRIFWLDSNKEKELYNFERSRLFKVLNNNYYNKKVLKEYFQSQYDDEALDKIQNTPKQDSGVYFPIKIKSDNKYLPLVSFSEFAVDESANYAYSEDSIIALKNKLNIEIKNFFIPKIALYEKLEGKSYNLAFVTHILFDNKKHLFKNLPSICCTGIVDEYGNIKKIDFAKEKYEAAKQMGFDYIFFPYENKNEISETENLIFFNDIIELNNWIVELANNKAKDRITHWLSIGGEIPNQSDFNSFFYITLNKGVSYWQSFLRYNPIDEAIKKINRLQEAYNAFINNFKKNNNESILTRFLLKYKNSFSSYRFYALIPELLNILKDYNKLSDYLYKQIKEAVKCQSPDFAIATKILKNNLSIFEITENQFLREKYPQILCFYFKHPTELIYILSSIQKPTNKEIKILEIICDLLKKNCSDSQIINATLSLLNPVYSYQFETTAESIPHSHQLALLECAIENLNINNRKKYIDQIKKYSEKIFLSLENNDKDKLSKLINEYKKKLNSRQLNTQIIYKNNSKQTSIDSYDKLKNLYKRTTKESDLGPLALNKNIYNYLKYNYSKLEDKLSTNNYRNKFLNDFCKSLNLGKMGDLITECISFFYGKYIVRWDNPRDILLLTKKKFDFPFSIGLMCQKQPQKTKEWYFQNQYPIICSLIKEIFNKKEKPPLRQLMWLYLLYYSYNLNDEYQTCYEKYKKIIVPELEKYLLSLIKSLKERSEFKREFEFIASLFGICSNALSYNNFSNEAFHVQTELEINPQKTIARTEQLLFPIFIFLQENKFNTANLFEKFGSQLNNARFVIEFIRIFGYDSNVNELFRPIHGFSELEKQLFETMTIIRLDQESYFDNHYMLKNYILSNITNFTNLQFALSLIEK